ncbi:hypothetical protein [Hypericibacter sp.]|uniref:hypothetical protein n=1 Tax=Hypericibacter sp. TaxID=2705401 RepID=UPI003D6D9BCA
MNLTPVTPTTPATGPSAARPVSMAVAGTGQNNLALLGQLGAGDILSGTVLERAADGTLTVRTDRGVLALSGGLEAAVGSKVMLELRSTGARMQVILLSVDGEPTANQPLSGPRIGILTLLDAGKGAVAQAGDLSATTRPGAPAGPTLPPVPLPPLADQAGVIGARVVATLLRPSDSKPATQLPLPNAPLPQAGQRLPYHLAAILPPVTQAVTAAVEEAPRQAFIATVRQQTPEGELVLESPLGTIRIPRPPEAAAPQTPLPAKPTEAAPLPPSPGKTSSPLPASAPVPNNAAAAEATPEPAPSWPAGTRLVLALPAPVNPGLRDAVPAGPRLVATVLRAAEPQAPTPAAQRNGVAAPTPPSNAPAAPIAGTRVPLELVSVLPPVGTGTNGSAAANPASGSQTAVLATLRAPSPNGQAILATPEGLVALDRPIEGPVGTRLLLLPTPQAPALPEAHPGPAQIFNALLETAALLDGERATLAAPASLALPTSVAPGATTAATAQDTPAVLLNPTQTNDILAQNLPRVGSHLAAGLAGFIRARLSDKPVTWPSAELRQALQSAGRPELAAKLEQGFAELARAAPSTSQDGQWKTIVLPLLDEQALHQARLAIRRDPGKGDQPKDGKPASVHFLLDVELSRMGAMQLDGLVRGKRFDLMLRTHKPLDSTMQNEIQRLFAEAKSVTGITGEIYFQVAAVFASPDANAPVPSHAGGLIA